MLSLVGQISADGISEGDSLHDVSNPIFLGKTRKNIHLTSTDFAERGVKPKKKKKNTCVSGGPTDPTQWPLAGKLFFFCQFHVI